MQISNKARTQERNRQKKTQVGISQKKKQKWPINMKRCPTLLVNGKRTLKP